MATPVVSLTLEREKIENPKKSKEKSGLE